MRTLGRDDGRKLWTRYWDEMRESWLKIEVLSEYESNSPSWKLWQEGRQEESIRLLRSPDNAWRNMCQAKIAQGVQLRRVRVLEPRLTDYTQWEMWHYRLINVPGGEQVSVVNRGRVKDLRLPPGDVMIFDGRRAVRWNYDQAGSVISGVFYDHRDEQFSQLKEVILTVMGRARPFK